MRIRRLRPHPREFVLYHDVRHRAAVVWYQSGRAARRDAADAMIPPAVAPGPDNGNA
jgi:hypothetical protein